MSAIHASEGLKELSMWFIYSTGILTNTRQLPFKTRSLFSAQYTCQYDHIDDTMK